MRKWMALWVFLLVISLIGMISSIFDNLALGAAIFAIFATVLAARVIPDSLEIAKSREQRAAVQEEINNDDASR